MASDTIRLVLLFFRLYVPLIFGFVGQKLVALRHKWTYKYISSAKNVVVLGGSFAGLELAKNLSNALPTGYKVTLIEQNSHFNFVFNFPRFSVIKGREHLAFIPYDGFAKKAPEGIFTRVQGEAVHIARNAVQLKSGKSIGFEYLAIATGTSSPLPNKVLSRDREGGCAELRSIQGKIASSSNIAVVGGGAAGVEIASDIKSYYPDKKVTLIHSRNQLLPTFGRRLHEHTLEAFKEMNIQVILSQRPQVDSNSLVFVDGRKEDFDLVIPCPGQKPNSAIIEDLAPESISKATSRILVKPTLQLQHPDDPPHIFALGDVAETGGPKMARATYFQAGVVARNILALIDGKLPSSVYKPLMELEGSIKLTLGKGQVAIYSRDGHGGDILVPMKGGKEELDVALGWGMVGSNIKHAEQ
ncbi:putative AMID-like mitochondrial oxidoreductase [Phaeosphaeriaceae sp. PMI808]|nr:putative AMID-like mitochondrial oxidoreductase [Phaeosphaeriaceae sp. PMI808]